MNKYVSKHKIASYCAAFAMRGIFILTLTVMPYGAAASMGNVERSKPEKKQVRSLSEPLQPRRSIATYMQSRAGHALNGQPKLIGLLSGTVKGGFNLKATEQRGRFDFSKYRRQPTWVHARGSWSKSGGRKNRYFLAAVGTHSKFGKNTIMGFMVQADKLRQKRPNSMTEGTGFLIGSYIVTKLPKQPLYFEGRYLLGKTEGNVMEGGLINQAFSTNRTLANIRVAGKLVYDDLTLTPSLSAAYVLDKKSAFRDRADNVMAGQGVSVVNLSAGLNFDRPYEIKGDALKLTGGIAAVYSASKRDGFASTLLPDYEGGRGRVHFGATFVKDNGITLNAGADYDGIGADKYESWDIDLGFKMTF